MPPTRWKEIGGNGQVGGIAGLLVQSELYPRTRPYRQFSPSQRYFLRNLRHRLRFLAACGCTFYRPALAARKKCPTWNPITARWEGPDYAPLELAPALSWYEAIFRVRERMIERNEYIVVFPDQRFLDLMARKDWKRFCKYWRQTGSKWRERGVKQRDFVLKDCLESRLTFDKDDRNEWTGEDDRPWLGRTSPITSCQIFRNFSAITTTVEKQEDGELLVTTKQELPAINIIKDRNYYKLRTGSHKDLATIPRGFLEMSLSATELQILGSSHKEKRRALVRKIVLLWFDELVSAVQEDPTFQSDITSRVGGRLFFEGELRRIRTLTHSDAPKAISATSLGIASLVIAAVRRLFLGVRGDKRSVSVIGLLAYDTVCGAGSKSRGAERISQAWRLKPFAWVFRHTKKTYSVFATEHEVSTQLCTTCECSQKQVSRRLPDHLQTQCDGEEDHWLPTSTKQARDIVRENARRCAICGNEEWKAVWFKDWALISEP